MERSVAWRVSNLVKRLEEITSKGMRWNREAVVSEIPGSWNVKKGQK